MSRLGWCMDGHHGDCRKAIATTLGRLRCSCPCHDDQEEAA